MVTTSLETWKVLFGHALSLIDDVLRHGTTDLYWTFGGGTVLMLRHTIASVRTSTFSFLILMRSAS